MDIQFLETQCRSFLSSQPDMDSAHKLDHTERVVDNARLILKHEQADHEITIAAAWLHDCVVLPKNDPERHRASEMAAKKATLFLQEIGFDDEKQKGVEHAIHAHSFSADVKSRSMEAKIVQDADRLDALGAVGIARCFTVGGKLNRPLYASDDPFCENRLPDDSHYTLDHFYAKLFTLADSMNTETGKREADKRVRFMKEYLNQFQRELGGSGL